MIKKLFCLWLLRTALCFTIANEKDKIFVGAHEPALISPFSIRGDQSETDNTKLLLVVECSEDFLASFTFADRSADLCSNGPKTGTITEINALLDSFKGTVPSAASNGMTIKYTLSTIDGSGDRSPFNFSQQILTLTKIPVTLRTPSIHITKSNLLVEQKFLILSVAGEYYNAGTASSLKSAVEPDVQWLTVEFEGPNLFIIVKPSQSTYQDTTVSIAVVDEAAKLKSDSLTIKVDFTELANAGLAKKDTSVYFLVVLGVFVIIIIVLIVLLLYANKQLTKRQNFEKSIEKQKRMNHSSASTQQSYEARPNVLSDSIINWNKRMVSKYQQKASSIFHMTNSKIKDEVTGQNESRLYDKFDDSENLSNDYHNMNNSSQPSFEEMSAIYQPHTSPGLAESYEHSAFADELNL